MSEAKIFTIEVINSAQAYKKQEFAVLQLIGMKKKFLYIVIITMSFILTGCGRELYEPQLPDNYILFDNFGFESKQVEEDVCPAFEYNGRTYYFYSYCRYYEKYGEGDCMAQYWLCGKE